MPAARAASSRSTAPPDGVRVELRHRVQHPEDVAVGGEHLRRRRGRRRAGLARVRVRDGALDAANSPLRKSSSASASKSPARDPKIR